LATLVERPSLGAVLNDLNWARLTGWREIIAEAFDPAPRRRLLTHLDQVRIVYGQDRQVGTASDLARALLLAGWLSALLGWRPAPAGWTAGPAGVSTALVRSGAAPADVDTAADGDHAVDAGIELLLVHDPSMAHRCDGITQVSLRAAEQASPRASDAAPGTGVRMTFAWPGDSCVCTAKLDEGSGETLLHTRQMPVPPDDELLCTELEYLRRDEVYVAAVVAAAALAGLPGSEALAGPVAGGAPV
jgi:hypothetical protein